MKRVWGLRVQVFCLYGFRISEFLLLEFRFLGFRPVEAGLGFRVSTMFRRSSTSNAIGSPGISQRLKRLTSGFTI